MYSHFLSGFVCYGCEFGSLLLPHRDVNVEHREFRETVNNLSLVIYGLVRAADHDVFEEFAHLGYTLHSLGFYFVLSGVRLWGFEPSCENEVCT